jgi:hypothetical protein
MPMSRRMQITFKVKGAHEWKDANHFKKRTMTKWNFLVKDTMEKKRVKIGATKIRGTHEQLDANHFKTRTKLKQFETKFTPDKEKNGPMRKGGGPKQESK